MLHEKGKLWHVAQPATTVGTGDDSRDQCENSLIGVVPGGGGKQVKKRVYGVRFN